jgi:hypothetical protein
MDAQQLQRGLEAGEIVRLDRDDWDSCRDRFRVMERHDTGLRGELLIVAGAAGLAVVEEPSTVERVVRPLPSLQAARELLADRLATYDRMWDGCGCKIDYYR